MKETVTTGDTRAAAYLMAQGQRLTGLHWRRNNWAVFEFEDGARDLLYDYLSGAECVADAHELFGNFERLRELVRTEKANDSRDE